MLSSDKKIELVRALLDTEDHSSYLYQFLSSDKKESPQRFAEKPELKFECSKEFKQNLSDLFDLGQKKHNIQEGYWLVILKRQIIFEIEQGLITNKDEGKNRIKALFQEFTTLFQNKSVEAKEIKESKALSDKFKLFVVESFPIAQPLVPKLEQVCNDEQTKIILNEFKANQVVENLTAVVNKFKLLKEKSVDHTAEENLAYKSLAPLFTYINSTLDILTNYEAKGVDEKIKLGLMVVAINDICENVIRKNKCETQDLERFLGQIRAIKNMGIKDVGTFSRATTKLSHLFTSEHKQPSEVRVFKGILKNNILDRHPDPKSIKEVVFDKTTIDSLREKLQQKPAVRLT